MEAGSQLIEPSVRAGGEQTVPEELIEVLQRGRKRRAGRLIRRIITYGVFPVVVVGLWWTSTAVGWVNPTLIPSPPTVVISWYEWFFGSTTSANASIGTFAGTGFPSVWASLQRVLIGFASASIVGAILGVLIGRFVFIRRLLDPTLQFLRPIPVTAWLPFAIVLFGIRDTSALFLVFLAAFFPVLLNTTGGVRGVPLNYIRAGQMLGASESAILFRIVLRAALPSIMTGLRLALGYSWTSVIVAEMLAVKSGIGYVLWNSYSLFEVGYLGAAMVTIGLLGYLSDLLIRLLSKRLIFWSQT